MHPHSNQDTSSMSLPEWQTEGNHETIWLTASDGQKRAVRLDHRDAAFIRKISQDGRFLVLSKLGRHGEETVILPSPASESSETPLPEAGLPLGQALVGEHEKGRYLHFINHDHHDFCRDNLQWDKPDNTPRYSPIDWQAAEAKREKLAAAS
ncbi:hypothetical protein AA0472_1338 [Acetobacter estunensis NRIC 0472]|nr:hypothetical protein AA0472_1338 [Acetobacter estunensis NRIC 0472]